MTAGPTPACAAAQQRGRGCIAQAGPDALTPGHGEPDGRHALPACTGCGLRPNALLYDLGRRTPAARRYCLIPNPADAATRLRLLCRTIYGWQAQ